MHESAASCHRLKRIYRWIGVTCWLMIIAAKVVRVPGGGSSLPVIGIAPSVLGPAGLLFVVLASEGRFAGISLRFATLSTALIALGLEFAQLLPMVRGLYTFDWRDAGASVLSVCGAALVSAGLQRRLLPAMDS